LTLEHLREPIGIGEERPRISWQVSTDQTGWRQSAYEIAMDRPDGAHGDQWTSGCVDSGESVLVDWPAPPLRSRERRRLRVRVWGAAEGTETELSPWSDWLEVEAGLLDPADWSAVLIGPDRDEGDRPDRPPVRFRRAFEIDGDIVAARLYVTSHGVYTAEINGTRIGDHVLAPGWTAYRDRLRYQTFDVSALLRRGPNMVGATVAEGWYVGHLGFHGGRRRIWGDDVALLAQLEVRYADGRVERTVTDAGWTWATGPIVSSGIYAGETYDARLERRGWSGGEPAGPADPTGADRARHWLPVRTLGSEKARLIAPMGPPIRRIQEIAPVAIFRSPSGRTIVDFGQNLVGRVRIRVSGAAGTTISLRHAEVLEDGEIATRPLRGAAAVDRYTLRGGGAEEWEPQFTYHGFRYVEITGWPAGAGGSDALAAADVRAADVRAVATHTDMARTGWFECSEPLLNRFHENVLWTMRGNFMDIPTDCPQRDERLGWGGDLGVFAPTASFLYDCSGLLSSWLVDLAADQAALGTVPLWVPWFQITFPLTPSSVWGDAAVLVPWVVYRRFGDAWILRRQYASMKAWVDQVAALTGPSHLWQSGLHLGDWLDPSAPADAPEAARTDKYFIATAYHAITARLLARSAAILGETEDERRYSQLADEIRDAFRAEYVSANGLVVSDAQTAYALALELDLLDETQRARAARRLLEIVRANGHRIGTGFVGGRVICDALVDSGDVDAAYHMLLRTDCPSWLYAVTMGATTIWERWDSMLPDGRLNPGDMLSFNHYALGSVADWLHRTVAGLAPAEPGYRRILVAPQPGGGLSSARAAHETPYGLAEVSWTRAAGKLKVEVTVPVGAMAAIRLPDPDWTDLEVGPGHHSVECPFRDPADDQALPPPPQHLGLPPQTESGLFGD
jgi:alpha-L-rhamnosidase